MKVIFLPGAHGVGKGFLGSKAANTLNINHYTASELIKEEKNLTNWTKDKLTADIDDNQIALIKAVERRCSQTEVLLLDGHFVLRNRTGEMTKLPVEVFSALNISGVIVLEESAAVIAYRLSQRDGIETSEELITKLTNEEKTHAEAICYRLHLPLTILSSPTEFDLINAINALLK